MGYGDGGTMPAIATAEKAEDDMMLEQVVLTDGTDLKMLRSPKMSEEQWQQTKMYLQNNPAETKKLVEHSTNPDKIRRQKMMRAMADVWQDQIDSSNEDFAKRMKELEQEPEFEALFASIKDYQVQQIRDHLEDKELMQKISNKMGGVPSQALRNAERIRKTPLTLQEACKFGDLRAVQRYLSETEAAGKRDLEAKDQRGITCLGYAVGANRMPVTMLLVEVKADINCVDKSQNSSLHYAAAYGRQEILEYLVSQGADFNKANASGQTPLGVAIKNEQLRDSAGVGIPVSFTCMEFVPSRFSSMTLCWVLQFCSFQFVFHRLLGWDVCFRWQLYLRACWPLPLRWWLAFTLLKIVDLLKSKGAR
ncbi:unnamed protein product [Durusdinium trenchii]|uniref:Uncharacterized protein n=1 Tax=Durusdinium trenchii TaxID=1381693 RepID=A0ABP0RYX4_9DINO